MRRVLNYVLVSAVFVLLITQAAYPAAKPNCNAIVKGHAPVNGTSLYYEIKGCGVPVVLNHGLTLDTRMWEPQFHLLTRYFRVIRYDARGHGLSGGITSPYSSVEDLDALLNYLGIDQAVHVVGLSRGADVALKYAIAHNDRVRSVVSMDASLSGWPDWLSYQFIYRFFGYKAMLATDGIEAALDAWRQDPLFGPANETPGVRTKLKKMIDRHADQGVSGRFATNIPDTDPPAIVSLYQITAPLMVTVGEDDLVEFHLMAQAIKDGAINATEKKFFEVPNAGHMSNMENPEFVTGTLLVFLLSN